MLPFVETGELAVLSGVPAASTHRNLERLRLSGLARRVPHSMDTVRRTYRWIPTANGVRTLPDSGLASDDRVRDASIEAGEWIPVTELSRGGGTLQAGRATMQWHRVMSARLDILACVYRLACAIRRVECRPAAEFRLYRSHPYDAAVRLSDGRCYGIIVRGPGFGGAQFARRLSIARADALRLTATFIMVLGQEDSRAAAVEAHRSSRMMDIATVIVPARSADNPDTRVCVEPDNPDGLFSLRRVLTTWTAAGRLPDERTATRRHPPDDGMAMPPYLSTGVETVLHAIADWPFAVPSTLAAIAGMSEHWLTKRLGELRRNGLVRSVRVNGRGRLALTDDGIRRISAASRTNAREHMRHWSSERGPDGEFIGGGIRQLVREIGHNDMVHSFVAAMSRHAGDAPCIEIGALAPAHLGMKFFRHLGLGTYSIRPDTTIVVSVNGRRHVLLIEFERQAVYPKRMRERLMPYERYFSGKEWLRDYGDEPKVLVVLEDDGIETRFLMSQEAAGLSHLPVFTSNSGVIECRGPYGKIWRRLPDHVGARVEFWME